MRKKLKKLVLSKDTLRRLDSQELSGPRGGAALADTEDRRCEPSIVSCPPSACTVEV